MLQSKSIGSYGVNLFNTMSWAIRAYNGELKEFKQLLDELLSSIPEEPFTETLHPSAKDLYGEYSNCITDWIRLGRYNQSLFPP